MVKKSLLNLPADICVFYKHQSTYNPQGLIILDKPIKNRGKSQTKNEDSVYKTSTLSKETYSYVTHYPRHILEFKCQREGLHPTQKPVALFEYLIQTYTNPGELVLDNCMGSGTTAVACINIGRNFTGFEWDETYFQVASERICTLLSKTKV